MDWMNRKQTRQAFFIEITFTVLIWVVITLPEKNCLKNYFYEFIKKIFFSSFLGKNLWFFSLVAQKSRFKLFIPLKIVKSYVFWFYFFEIKNKHFWKILLFYLYKFIDFFMKNTNTYNRNNIDKNFRICTQDLFGTGTRPDRSSSSATSLGCTLHDSNSHKSSC